MVFSGFYQPTRQSNRFWGPGSVVGTMLASRPALAQSFRTRTRTPTQTALVKRRRTRPQSHSFKNKVMNTQPAKHQSGQPSQNLLHDNFYVFSPTQLVTQGDLNSNRTGDSIYISALKLKGCFFSPTAASAYVYRLLVLWSGEEVDASGFTLVASGDLAPATVMLPSTQTAFGPNAMPNPKAVTVLYDETIDINSQVATASDVSSFATTVQINQQFPYQASASQYGKGKNLYVMVVGSTANGVDNVTVTGVCQLSFDLIFKE